MMKRFIKVFILFAIILYVFNINIKTDSENTVLVKAAIPSSPTITLTPAPTKVIEPTQIPTPTPIPIVRASYLAAGDVIMHGSVIRSGYITEDEYDYSDIFTQIKPYIDSSDFATLTFEGVTMYSDKNYTGYPMFNAPPAIMKYFLNAGFNMINTATNHCLDRRLKGMFETIDVIKKNNMKVIGTYESEEEKRYHIVDINSIKLGFLTYTYGFNGLEASLSKEEIETHLSVMAYDKMEREIKELKPLVDKVLVFMHWGAEYRRYASEEQKRLADHLFSWGADVILGSHAHVVAPSEVRIIDGEVKYLVYSLGNFLSNQIRNTIDSELISCFTEDGLVVSFEFKKNLDTGVTEITKIKHIPTWNYRYKVDGVFKYKIHPIPSPDHESLNGFDDALKQELIESYHRSIELLEDYTK